MEKKKKSTLITNNKNVVAYFHYYKVKIYWEISSPQIFSVGFLLQYLVS